MAPETRYFGVRHHGPGSARSLSAVFDRWRPDVVLIEGPPDADALLNTVGHPDLVPPVALMVYDPARPRRAAFYPFAAFSPEWVAMAWARRHVAEVAFMDLPLRHQMALEQAGWGVDGDTEPLTSDPDASDPLGALARAAGAPDGEAWWNRLIEERRSDDSAFEAIHDAMAALRDEIGPSGRTPAHRRREAMREAFMRKTIRAAERRGAQRLAVVAGAWHVPALSRRPKVGEDNALLAKMPRRKTVATWVAWSHGRLSMASGYGAGVRSPGWYHHLFASDDTVAAGWLTRVARSLRGEGFDVPPASVIDAVRLADSLAVLRRRSLPGLEELEDAALATFLHGQTGALTTIETTLVVGEVLGEVPEDVVKPPLAADLEALQRSLRMKPKAEAKEIVLDLREASARARSELLHRLAILDVPWGQGGERLEGKGTFKESWTLMWAPELALRLLDAARFGNTVAEAASRRMKLMLRKATELERVAHHTERVISANLPQHLALAARQLDAAAASAQDVSRLAEAIPQLARWARYGEVRGTDRDRFESLLDGFLARFRAGLVSAGVGLAAEPDEVLAARLEAVDRAVRLLGGDRVAPWTQTLDEVSRHEGVAPSTRGRATRKLLDGAELTGRAAGERLATALARGTSAAEAIRWLDGFLAGSALLLLHDEVLLGLLDDWLTDLGEGAFEEALPLLRRSFSDLPAAERKRLGIRLRTGAEVEMKVPPLDEARAREGLEVAARLLGLAEDNRS